ncbi:hypothetical protein [Hahella ganghwensis]|nr:hypothetical protein [Hahella ganghwensis]
MTNYYNQNATQVFSRYQRLSFEENHSAKLNNLSASLENTPGN